MKKLFILMVCLFLGIAVIAQTHTVERGESLQSIANRYNITTSQLVEANPGADKLFYVGMVLNIPESKTGEKASPQINQIETQQPEVDTYVKVSESHTTPEFTAHDFTHFYATYVADPEFFDLGFYGLGFHTYNDKGFGVAFSVLANWGIVNDGNIMSKFGVNYGYPINKYFMVDAALCGMIYTYDVLSKKKPNSTDEKVGGGISLTPGVKLKCGSLVIGAGFEFGWVNQSKELYKTIHLSVGFCI